jgi:hypothetical protein
MNEQKRSCIAWPKGNASIELVEVTTPILCLWASFIAEELAHRGEILAWAESLPVVTRRWLLTDALLTASTDDLLSEIHAWSNETLRGIAEATIAETQRRGIALGRALADPDVGETAMEATIRKMVRADPTQALEAFDSLARFCGEVASQVRAQIATPETRNAGTATVNAERPLGTNDRMRRLDVSLEARRAADGAGVPDTEPPETEPEGSTILNLGTAVLSTLLAIPETEPEGSTLLNGSIHWRDLRVWVRANRHVHQKHEPLYSPVDCWRWLDMFRREGLAALHRCGLEIRFVGGEVEPLLHQDQAIDWVGFPGDPPTSIAPRPEVEP